MEFFWGILAICRGCTVLDAVTCIFVFLSYHCALDFLCTKSSQAIYMDLYPLFSLYYSLTEWPRPITWESEERSKIKPHWCQLTVFKQACSLNSVSHLLFWTCLASLSCFLSCTISVMLKFVWMCFFSWCVHTVLAQTVLRCFYVARPDVILQDGNPFYCFCITLVL